MLITTEAALAQVDGANRSSLTVDRWLAEAAKLGTTALRAEDGCDGESIDTVRSARYCRSEAGRGLANP